jgi:hypothetical protein
MTPTDRINLISELRRSFPAHSAYLPNRILHVALDDYEALALAQPRITPKPRSRALYMREHRKKERAIIQKARLEGITP